MTKSGLRRRDRGISMIVVVILVLVTVVLVFGSIVLYTRLGDLAHKQRQIEAELKYEEMEREGVLLQKIEKDLWPTALIADKAEIGTLDAAKVAAEVDKRRGAILAEVETDPKLKDVNEKVAKAREESGRYGTLESLLLLQASKLVTLQDLHDQAKLELDLAKSHVDARTAARPEILKSKEQYKARLQQMIAELQQKIQAEDGAYNTRKTELTTKRDEADAAITEEQAGFIQWEIKENNKIKDLRRRLDEMRVKEVIKHTVTASHGRLLRPDAQRKTAFIDIGSRDRVVAGLRFKVARVGREGRFEFKGDVEVKKVWVDTAEVAVLKIVDGAAPMIDGDVLVNPFFSTKRPVVVAFVGMTDKPTVRLKMSAREAGNRIREIGSEPRYEVGLDTDFVLFTESTAERSGEEQWPDWVKARSLELPIAQATEYYDFLGN